jgi:copper(I)-binding protein
MRWFLFILGVFPVLAAASSWADDRPRVERVVLSAATTDTRPTALFFDVVNDGAVDDALVAVETPLCGRTELHDHIRDGDVMKMRAVSGIPVPAGVTVRLKPMGLHVMCFTPRLPQQPGVSFPLTLVFDRAGRGEATGQIVTFDQALRRGEVD